MALEPITRQEKIIAGQDLTPITRMEKFLKQYGGGSGGGGTKIYHDSYSGKTYTDEQLAIELVFSDAVKVELPVTIALYSQGSFTGAEVSVVAKMVQDTTAYFYYVVPTDESGGFEMLSVTVRGKSGPM